MCKRFIAISNIPGASHVFPAHRTPIASWTPAHYALELGERDRSADLSLVQHPVGDQDQFRLALR
jgi:hypothetical protein